MKHLAAVFLLLALSYWSVRPLFSPGFFPMHDDVQPTRVQQMVKALRDGQFPVRWVPDLGYGFGYPIFNFYAPLPYYIGALGMLAGFDALAATKLMMGLGMILAGLSMYVLISRIGGIAAGVMGSVLYLYAPYHAVNLYVRGAVGEMWAYGFLPLLIFGVYEVLCGGKKRGMLWGSAGLAAILLSHNILGMITLIFFFSGIIAYAILYRKKEAVIYLAALFLLGVGLSAFFTIPAFAEKGYTRVEELTKGGSDFRQHFVYPDQLWDSPWGYAGSAPGRADGMSFKIGKLHLMFGMVAYGALLFYSGKNSTKQSFIIGQWSLCVFFISIFFLLPASRFLWENISGLAYIQYPWRFLNLALLGLCTLPPVVLSLVPGKWKWITAAVIIVPVVMTNGKYFVPQYRDMRTAADYTDLSNIRFAISKISDEYMPADFPPPVSSGDVSSAMPPSGDHLLSSATVTDSSTRKIYAVEMREDAVARIPIAYFPGWRALIDGEPTPVVQKDGQIFVAVPKGMHTVDLMLSQTRIELMGNAISLFSLFLLGYVSLSGAALQTWGRNRPSRS